MTNAVRNRRATDTNVVQIVTNITLLSSMTEVPVYLGFPVVNAWQPDYGGGVDQWGNGDNIVAKFTPK